MSIPSSSFPKSSPLAHQLSSSMNEEPEIPMVFPMIITASPNPDTAPPTTVHPLIVHYVFTDDPPPEISTAPNTHTISVKFDSVDMDKISEARSFSKDWQLTGVRTRRVQGIEGGEEGVVLEVEGMGKETVVRTAKVEEGKELWEKVEAAGRRWEQLGKVVGFDGDVKGNVAQHQQHPQHQHQNQNQHQ
ncbi:hypothetical protein BJ508DRAFT_410252 [Ascobolus immersus RN42]|uniref:Uncharacterized protein n=1 Tax=Ascobolus immersus RN42 TaxID=1160509 RepID=A0A3N4IMW9_ASCIM|nr:hypothetical protein BJ508DRAFT_410252 [Ascobolus immersus RN42]